MLLVVLLLDGAAAVGFADGAAHAVGVDVGVEDGSAVEVARGAAHGLNQRAGGTQEAFFIGVQDGDQRYFGQIQTFAQQIDAHQDVDFAAAQIAQDLHAVQRGDLRV